MENVTKHSDNGATIDNITGMRLAILWLEFSHSLPPSNALLVCNVRNLWRFVFSSHFFVAVVFVFRCLLLKCHVCIPCRAFKRNSTSIRWHCTAAATTISTYGMLMTHFHVFVINGLESLCAADLPLRSKSEDDDLLGFIVIFFFSTFALVHSHKMDKCKCHNDLNTTQPFR